MTHGIAAAKDSIAAYTPLLTNLLLSNVEHHGSNSVSGSRTSLSALISKSSEQVCDADQMLCVFHSVTLQTKSISFCRSSVLSRGSAHVR